MHENGEPYLDRHLRDVIQVIDWRAIFNSPRLV
jgi:hypothetical protein